MKIKNPNTFEKAMEFYKNMKPSNRYKVIDLYLIEDRFLTMDDAVFVTCSYRKKIKDMFKEKVKYEN